MGMISRYVFEGYCRYAWLPIAEKPDEHVLPCLSAPGDGAFFAIISAKDTHKSTRREIMEVVLDDRRLPLREFAGEWRLKYGVFLERFLFVSNRELESGRLSFAKFAEEIKGIMQVADMPRAIIIDPKGGKCWPLYNRETESGMNAPIEATILSCKGELEKVIARVWGKDDFRITGTFHYQPQNSIAGMAKRTDSDIFGAF